MMDGKDEVKKTLDEVDGLIRSTKRRLTHGPATFLFVTWGLIWFVSFLGVHFQPRAVNWLPPLGCGIGMAALWLATRRSIKTRGRPSAGDARIGAAWLVLTAYAVLWMFLLHPQREPSHAIPESVDTVNRLLAFFASVGMCGLVVMGLWFGRFLVVVGAAVTGLVLIGLFALPQWFLIWMAVVGSGALTFSGVMVKRLWAV